MKVKIIALTLSVLMIALSICSCTGQKQDSDIATDTTVNNPNLTPEEILKPVDNDFRSRTETKYSNINGKDVTVYGFYIHANETENNPNFSQAVLIDQCINYKKAHPDERVTLSFTSFYLSIYAAACIDPESPNYGKMKSLQSEEYTSDGFVRISHLLLEAARYGVEVTIVARRNSDIDHNEYFLSHLNDDAYIEGKKISDFMTYRKSFWTAYDDRGATDMMHNKLLAVSNYTDYSGNDHGKAIWVGSVNLDGINEDGSNGNTGAQSALIVAEHDELWKVVQNFITIMVDYCDQEQALIFRRLINSLNTEQIALINEGRGDEIPEDEQIVYIGTATDSIFELYFTSFGGTTNSWDTVNNPYCKYISKLSPSISGGDYIECLWVNPKYKQDFFWSDTAMKYIANAFKNNPNTKNVVNFWLPGANAEYFADLKESENVGVCSINEIDYAYHNKDLQISYAENGVRHYVTLYNSLNMHGGSMYYQTNTLLVIHETEQTGNYTYLTYKSMYAPHIDFDNKRVTTEN